MAKISIVVPIYNVQPYLRECLDSILNQTFRDIEVIAVDDRSPDGCGAIIDEYAARDFRVRPLHLPENVGLGGARNAGLAVATGEYVWFVDSDDSLTEGSLAAVAQRLAATDPDVLIVDYARTYWWGAQKRNMLHELLSDPDQPDVFRIAQRPELLQLFPCAWNKVVRREFLIAAELPFPSGWYEDLPFTYPLLAHAERVSVLPRVCVLYRQRRSGSILGTTSDRHFEVFAQYDLVFERLARAADGARIRPWVLGHAMNHCLVVLGNPRRLNPDSRSRFFQESVLLRKRHLTGDDYILPPDASPARHRLLALGSWLGYRSMRHAHGRLDQTRRKLGGAKRKLGGQARGLRRKLQYAYYSLQRRRPIDQRLAVYSAYWGRGVRCNPAAIYERARELTPEVRGVWIVKADRVADVPPGVDYVVENSWRYFRVLARARWFINNVNFPDFVVKRKGSVHLQTHHGTALKSMGIDEMRYALTARKMNFGKLLKRVDRWDYSLAANTYSTEVWGRVYPSNYQSLEYGYPRNDILSTATAEDAAKVRAELGIRPDQKVVLYAPTHRDYAKGFDLQLDPLALAKALGPDGVVLMRAHYFYDRDASSVAAHPQVRDVSDHPSIEQLYLATDVLITDYSSVMFDFGVLDRPIVIYAPDWDVYRATRGTYFDLATEGPGPFCRSQDDLVWLFEHDQVRSPEAELARAAFRRRFCHLDDGRAAERVVRHLFLNQPAAA
ncbi:bifunctional glycosyltransferase/CDP-glycerol:glycerophosphate glycerophosphotransferase [Catellatospora tritici]|uniref:bifunctional glycosyltransferase/CDP-glycerol:glycerophosphate glycerophosphotransferase n=1 Tax=Catellatospora tritici TaxID=2851566 RepID=UPI001C2D49B1|nr:bifunctional glycosyltransferase family 2 protein/CDP-glycerol:glycerophosphate glycerophosphotransferase [Catellatospora tritici]MBV1849493.1 bifunctional glycosyltransferase family 2 protein/CDP-glycerol:glycerophosphate glycerophosphotransferase [Catellatospora tritici]MBV1854065.1 bifunctional glycosyltransferase family 2 protein/CDP-glycerol:glycerophosphate glycerophosphotransferase [Catellatospora tritici]